MPRQRPTSKVYNAYSVSATSSLTTKLKTAVGKPTSTPTSRVSQTQTLKRTYEQTPSHRSPCEVCACTLTLKSPPQRFDQRGLGGSKKDCVSQASLTDHHWSSWTSIRHQGSTLMLER